MTKRLILLVLVAVLAAMVVVPGIATSKPALERKIVLFSDEVNGAARAGLIKKFSDDTGQAIVFKKDLPLVNGAVVLLPPTVGKALEKIPGIELVEDDRLVSITGKPARAPQPVEVLPWGVDRIDADAAWTTSTASGVKVAIIDTGIDRDHPDLKTNIAGGINTVNPRKSAEDDNGHGTHVAGTIAGIDNEIGVIGVGPSASLYAVKAFGSSGFAYTSDIIEGIQWCVNNQMDVINMSFGSSGDTQALHDAITAAFNAGIVLVAAAGNNGPGDNTVSYPAKYSEVIAVAAADSGNNIASFSSRGPEVDISAPGVDILSTLKGDTYATWSGTSMAAPHVVGAVALVLEDNPTLTPSQVMEMIKNTAEPLPNVTDSNAKGAGLIDAEALVNCTP